MATQQHSEDDDPTIDVHVTATVERDYRRRNVLPEMWREAADRVQANGTCLHHDVRVAFAKKVLLADAQAQYTAGGERGTRNAYGALIRQLHCAIGARAREGTRPDPGIEKARELQAQSPAAFQAGEAAMLWLPGDDDHGQLVEIVRGLTFRGVADRNGPYWHAEERCRYSYRHVYLVRAPGEEAAWAGAHHLRNADGSVRHVQLVKG